MVPPGGFQLNPPPTEGGQGVLNTPSYFLAYFLPNLSYIQPASYTSYILGLPPLSFSLPRRSRIPPGRPKKITCGFLGPFLAIFWPSKKLLEKCFEKTSKKMRKSRIWPPKTLSKPSQNPSKIDVPKNMQFFIDFCSNFDACCKSQHQKNMRPRSVLLAFHIIRCFAFGMHLRSKKLTKNPSKMRSEPFQNRYRKRGVF